MPEVTITVPAPCGWLNSNLRRHRMQDAALAAQWRAAGKQAADGTPQFVGPVRILAYIWKPRAGRYDPNNLWPTVKAAVDGLVDAGVLVDDDHEHVEGPDMRHGGKGPARLVLCVETL